MFIERIENGPFSVNTYLVGCPKTQEAILIDPGHEADRIASRMSESGMTFVANTHCNNAHERGIRQGDACGALRDIQTIGEQVAVFIERVGRGQLSVRRGGERAGTAGAGGGGLRNVGGDPRPRRLGEVGSDLEREGLGRGRALEQVHRLRHC